MTKCEASWIVENYKKGADFKRFKSCNAYTSNIIEDATGRLFVLIKSYNTIVAIADITADVFIEFGKWSRTTSKQVTQIYNYMFRYMEREFDPFAIDTY